MRITVLRIIADLEALFKKDSYNFQANGIFDADTSGPILGVVLW